MCISDSIFYKTNPSSDVSKKNAVHTIKKADMIEQYIRVDKQFKQMCIIFNDRDLSLISFFLTTFIYSIGK